MPQDRCPTFSVDVDSSWPPSAAAMLEAHLHCPRESSVQPKCRYFGLRPDYIDPYYDNTNVYSDIFSNAVNYGIQVKEVDSIYNFVTREDHILCNIHVNDRVHFISFYDGQWTREVAKICAWFPFYVELRHGGYEIYTKSMHKFVPEKSTWVYDTRTGEIITPDRCCCGEFVRCFVDTAYGEVRLRYYCPKCDCQRVCSHCGKPLHTIKNVLSVPQKHKKLCDECQKSFRFCDSCRELYNYKDMGGDDVSRCYWCKPIRDYSHKPKVVLHGSEEFQCGIEVEAELLESDKELQTIDLQYCAGSDSITAIARMVQDKSKGFLFCKHDGSLQDGPGIEIVSQPAPLSWWKTCQEKEIIFELPKYGMRSYDTVCCGMHIHMSKKAFSSCHLYKMQKLLYESREWMYAISQRKNRPELSRWAQCSVDEREKKRLVQVAKKKSSEGYFERRMGLNLQPKDTAELRIFKGTLKKESFMKNLEFADATYSYTKQAGMEEVSIKKFGEWLIKNKKMYKYLYDFMDAKKILEGVKPPCA
jgi:hypothetical protein